jgi:hypothetical protein
MCPPAGDAAAAAGLPREVQRLAREVSPESMLTAEELRRVHVKKVEEERMKTQQFVCASSAQDELARYSNVE